MNVALMRQIAEAAVAPIRKRVAMLLLRAIVKTIDDSKQCQTIQVNHLANSTKDNIEKFEAFGFTSNPGPNAEALLLSMCGSLDNAVAILAQLRSQRPTNLQPGESQQYDSQGQHLYLKGGITAELKANNEIDLSAPAVKLGPEATKGVARLGDQVTITIPAGTFIGAVGAGTGGATAIPSVAPLQFTGTITAASANVKAVD